MIHTTDGTPVTDPQVQAQVEAMMAKVEQLPHVSVVEGPYTPVGAHQISADKQTAFINVTFDVQGQNVTTAQAKSFVNTALTAQGPHLQVAVSGQVAEQADRQSFGGTGLGILLAALVLLLVFGSVFAMAAADPVGPGIARHRHRRDRPPQPRPQDARVLDRDWSCSSASASASTTRCSSSPGTGRASWPATTSSRRS